jgi:hypothetical protein
MAEDRPRPIDVLLSDPIRETTRKTRRTLLGTSTVALAVSWAGLLPEKITALGIELSIKNQGQLLILIAAVVGYFLVAFIVYAASDFVAWHFSYSGAIAKRHWELVERELRSVGTPSPRTDPHALLFAGPTPLPPLTALVRHAFRPAAVVRAVVEFLLPLLIGLGGLVSVLRAWAHLPIPK